MEGQRVRRDSTLAAVGLFALLAIAVQAMHLALPGDGCQGFPSDQGLWIVSCQDASLQVPASLPHDITEVAGYPVEDWLAARPPQPPPAD